ncbi:MAG: FMN-binding negative transcriptional regulator [Thermoplasmataceae archaeon]
MYIPEYFKVTDITLIQQIIDRYSFAWIISPWKDDTEITPLPVLSAISGESLIIRGHMAKENPHWAHATGKTASVIIQGPHHYISPRWYVEEKSVPTWNYVMVKISGTFEILSLDETKKVLTDLSEKFDPEWRSKRMEEKRYYQTMLNQVVGFMVKSNKVMAKFKLAQNHPKGDLVGIYNNLQNSDENGVEMANLMKQMGLV